MMGPVFENCMILADRDTEITFMLSVYSQMTQDELLPDLKTAGYETQIVWEKYPFTAPASAVSIQ